MRWKPAGTIIPLVEHNYPYFVFTWKVQYSEITIESEVEELMICGKDLDYSSHNAEKKLPKAS